MDVNCFKRVGKISLVLILSFIISNFSIDNIFLAKSPKLRPNLPEYMLAKINYTKENILAKINFNFNFLPTYNQNNSLAGNKNEEETINLLKKSLKPVTKGVSAASKDNYSYTQFKVDEIEWAKITYTLKNGETVTIQYPKGTEPPLQAFYEGQKE